MRSWMENKGIGWATQLVADLNQGAHGKASGDLTAMHDDTRRLALELREVLA